METIRLTVATGCYKVLKNQFVERDGIENRFFEGCLEFSGMAMWPG